MNTPLALLRDIFGYPAFRGAQAEIIDHICQGGDALVLMPTGGGKSLCYQIPALLRPGCAVVVSPLIALMQDQVDALTQLGVKAAVLNSTLDWRDAQTVEQAMFSGQLDLVYIAPERLMLERTLAGVETFVNEANLDEAWKPEYDDYRWLPVESPLSNMVGKDGFAKARALLPNVRPQDLDRMKPWSVLALLEARGESGGEATLDARLQRIAAASG